MCGGCPDGSSLRSSRAQLMPGEATGLTPAFNLGQRDKETSCRSDANREMGTSSVLERSTNYSCVEVLGVPRRRRQRSELASRAGTVKLCLLRTFSHACAARASLSDLVSL